MQFQVPQFIETESTIVGPLSLRQFIYVAVGGGLCILALYLFQLIFAIIFIGIIGTATAAFTFIKINGQPFSSILLSAFGFYWNPRLYTWQKEAPKIEGPVAPELKTEKKERAIDPAAIRSKLAFGSAVQNLWEKITTSRVILPKREKEAIPAGKPPKEKYETIELNTGEREKVKRIDYR